MGGSALRHTTAVGQYRFYRDDPTSVLKLGVKLGDGRRKCLKGWRMVTIFADEQWLEEYTRPLALQNGVLLKYNGTHRVLKIDLTTRGLVHAPTEQLLAWYATWQEAEARYRGGGGEL